MAKAKQQARLLDMDLLSSGKGHDNYDLYLAPTAYGVVTPYDE